MNRFLFLFLVGVAHPMHAGANPADNPTQLLSQQVLARYFAAASLQGSLTRGVEMDMDFSARLPRLKKEGSMLARRIISSLGKISFVVKSFTGDGTVKKELIARYMSTEQDASEKITDAGINPKNYKFKFKRVDSFNGRPCYVYELNPRKKRVGLFKGELWIDEETSLPVREIGSFVKNPSVFLKKISFIRTYAPYNGSALPSRIESIVETRIAGKAEFDIRYSNFAPETPALESTPLPTPVQPPAPPPYE